jgi:2-amino-4-hydroxy-6-hydroxymethyldihydropteridine diphosphokinase
MATAYLGLGTNVGDRERNLRSALRRLGDHVEIEAISWVYQSEPVGYGDQPDFWNLAVRVGTGLEPDALLARMLEVELELGRSRPFANAPRTMDIDLLLYDDVVLDSPSLHVPHPRMLERAFVLLPLIEIEPGLRHPVTGERLSDVLARRPRPERVERLFPGDRLLDPAADD